MNNYFPEVAWGTIAKNVLPYYESNVFQLNKYTLNIDALDINEPGASSLLCSEGDYFIDYLGYPWQIISITDNTTYKTIVVNDVNERSISETINFGPYANRIGYVYRPIKGAIILSQAQLLKLDSQARDRINNIEKGVLWENLGNSDSIYDTVLGMQSDNTLDPGLTPNTGDNYIILDSANLNANFGTITGLEDNDIVEYDGSDFIVTFDASLTLVSITVTVTTDSDGNTNELWFYNTIDLEWQNSKTKLNYWTKTDDNLHYTSGKVSVGYGGSSPYGAFNVKGDVYIGRNNDGGTNESYYFYLYSQGSATNRNYRSRIFSSSGDGALPSNSGFILQNQYWNGTSYDYYTTISSYHNKVGINMSSPSYNLDVSGTFRATGNINLGGITYTPPTADGTNDYVLTTNGSGVLSWSQKTGGTSGTITSINGSSEAAQTITSGTGLTVTDSGTGNYIHTISAASGYIIPTTTDETNWNSALTHSLLTSGNPHSVTHDSTSPSAAASGITYGHINTSAQKMYGAKQWVGDKTIGRNNEGFINETYYLYLKSQGSATNNGYNSRILSIDGLGPQPADSGIGIDVQYWNGSSYAYKRVLSAYDTGLVSFASLKLTSTPSTDVSSSPVLVRDASTGEIKQTTLTSATNNYVTGASFNTGDGVLTLTRLGLSNVTVDLDGRYLTSFTESDPIFAASAAYGINSGDITSWQTSYNRSIDTNPSFNITNGIITFTQQDSSTLTVDLDGRYAYLGSYDYNSALTGANVFSNIVVSDGMISSLSTRALSYSDVGAAASSHTHGNISNVGAIGSTANLPLITTTSGVITTGAFGTGATNFAAGNHTHSGLYDNYGSWTATGDTGSITVSSGTSLNFDGSSGIITSNPAANVLRVAFDKTQFDYNDFGKTFQGLSGDFLPYTWNIATTPNIYSNITAGGTITITNMVSGDFAVFNAYASGGDRSITFYSASKTLKIDVGAPKTGTRTITLTSGKEYTITAVCDNDDIRFNVAEYITF